MTQLRTCGLAIFVPAQSRKGSSLAKRSLPTVVCIVFLFCAAAAIASPAQTFTTLASFTGANGAYPAGSLIRGTDGNFYGTTAAGGTYGWGTVFKINSGGTLTTLYSFDYTDGGNPQGGLVQATDGNFYGTTEQGGTGYGTVFQITPSGTLTTLHSFSGDDGSVPLAGLVQASDGNFYGTTYEGGTDGDGTVFKITPSGTLTTLYSFCAQTGCMDGGWPHAELVQASDGNFYGTTSGGGANDSCAPDTGCGTVFKITSGGTLTTLHNFNGTDGFDPQSGLVQATDGNFYGTTLYGGTYNDGTVFKMTPSGTLTTLHSFNNSAMPQFGLVQATDGNFYGTTSAGGTAGDGTVFKITPSGTLTTLYSFCAQTGCTDGADPYAGLVQASDGNFYGTTYEGGAAGDGTVFSLSVGLTPFVETRPSSGTFGAPVTILGTNLSAATGVFFNGTSASFQIVSSSEITTTVPVGATTGVVQVAIPGSTLISNTDFQVTGPLQLVPVTPCRLVDTRNGNPILGGTSQSFIIPQLGNCGIPATAAAYSLNVTVVPHGPLGYLTIWPQGEIQPYVSTMNSPDGRTKANAAIVPSGNNSVSVYASDTTDVILDIDGYFTAPGPQTYQFYTLPPCRIVDTRQNQDGGTLQAGVERDYTIPPNCGVPSTATAYSFNVTVLPAAGGLDYLTVWPKGETQPYVSTLNDYTGTVVANAAIVPAGTENATAFYPHDNNTDLLVDVNGYFAPAGTGGLSLYPVAPCRVLDTRTVNGGQPFQGVYNSPNGINVVGSPCAPPSTSQAFVFNATVVPSGVMPFLTLWPHGSGQPLVSTLNAYDGFITSNMAIVPSSDGSINAYAQGLTQLILDISGYFAP